ncbi:MAG: LysM peptidoglycan-binding domain-containing protein [Anaerolineae bacterium]|nr:LysM peptidoglycan-binding domain-containing protein [Anaerolineae bacterium]
MDVKRTAHWILLVLLMMLLSSCGSGGGSQPTPTATPAVPVDLTPATSPTPEMPPSLFFQPSVVDLVVGETAVVNVWLDSARRLNNIFVELSFDPRYVQVQDVDPDVEGVQVTAGNALQPVDVLRNLVIVGEQGRLYYQATMPPSQALDGGGIVASITLLGVAEGSTSLRFETVAASDPDGNPLELMLLSDGLVTVAGASSTEPTVQPTALPTVQPTAAPPQPTAAPTPAPGGGIYYVVQAGENLFRIGLKFDVTADVLAEANGIFVPSQLAAGAMLLVPVSPPAGRYGYYVQPGDTLYSIARRFGLTVEELAAYNGIGSDYTVSVGQVLVVIP